jgi:hypothetical protein
LASVLAMMGRSETLNSGDRPEGAAALTAAMRSFTAANGSPQSMYTSACLAPTGTAAPEAPPK